MCESVQEVVASLQNLLSDFDPSSFGQAETKELFEQFVLIERLGAAGKSLMGVQAAETNVWWEGYRSPAHYLADRSKCSVNHAAEMLQTVEQMKQLPKTDRAFRAGSLTELQAKEVVSAAVLDSASQRELLEIAELESLAELRRQASRVRAAAMSAEQRYQRAHKKRELKHWTDIEGTFHLAAGMTPESGAVVLACLRPFFEELTRAAAKSGIKERAAAHMADALVQMAERSRCIPPDALRPGPGAVVHLRMDYAALVRGYLKPGEICEVPGVGPIGLEAAKVFLGDSYRVGILMDGEDIRSVKGLGHSIPDRLRRAVHERDDWRCVVPGCGMDCTPKDIDHVIPVARGGETKLYNLALLCTWHHYLKTFHGYRLQHFKHRWLFSSPNDPPPKENSHQPELATVS